MEIFSMFHYKISIYGENIQVINHTTEKNYTLNFHWHKYNAALPALKSTSNCVCAWGGTNSPRLSIGANLLGGGSIGGQNWVYHVP